MQHKIKKYPVRHPLLKDYIKFFWELHVEDAQLNHKIIPQRNINLRFNLSETPHYEFIDGREHLLENAYFAGLQDHFRNAHIKLNGKVDLLGVCFLPFGFYPFLKIPVSEFKNQLLGAREAGFNLADSISWQLMEVRDLPERLNILESRLVQQLNSGNIIPEKFRQLFNALQQNAGAEHIFQFCSQNNLCKRKLERMFNKYVGLSAMTYLTLNRFQKGLYQLLYKDYSKLSDIAYRNGYFDQMHFIKDFRRFAGSTPRSFASQNDTLLNIGKLS